MGPNQRLAAFDDSESKLLPALRNIRLPGGGDGLWPAWALMQRGRLIVLQDQGTRLFMPPLSPTLGDVRGWIRAFWEHALEMRDNRPTRESQAAALYSRETVDTLAVELDERVSDTVPREPKILHVLQRSPKLYTAYAEELPGTTAEVALLNRRVLWGGLVHTIRSLHLQVEFPDALLTALAMPDL